MRMGECMNEYMRECMRRVMCLELVLIVVSRGGFFALFLVFRKMCVVKILGFFELVTI